MKLIQVTGTNRQSSPIYVVVDKIAFFYCDSDYRIQTIIKLTDGEFVCCTETTNQVQDLIKKAETDDRQH